MKSHELVKIKSSKAQIFGGWYHLGPRSMTQLRK